MARVYVTRQLPGDALARLAREHTVEVWPERDPPSAAQIRAHAQGAEALLTMISDRVDAALLDALPDLKVVANYGVGYDNINLAAAQQRNVAVSNTPDVLTDATADLTWALLMAAARHLAPGFTTARENWTAWEPTGFLGTEVAGATLGIIGHGRIGQAVARRARGFDMQVLAAGRDRAELEHVLSHADFISLHCPLTPQTRHLINAETLALVTPSSILINTARGAIVDQVALAEALSTGRLAGAALDVTDPEPLAPDDPLWQAPHLTVTPHIGSATTVARTKMATIAVDNILAGLAGQPLPNQVKR